MAAEKRRPRVAIVGSGLAGLTTAYLLHRSGVYDVEVLESGSVPALDAASVTTPLGARIDVPMRAFAPGYYTSLISLYKHLGIPLRRRRFLFRFLSSRWSSSTSSTADADEPYFTHPSNLHRLPPCGPSQSVPFYILQLLYLAFCYLYFTLCAFLFPPAASESLHAWTRRIQLPEDFTESYVLPLMSAVATCSFDELRRFPASDVAGYKRATHRRDHVVVDGGVGRVQSILLAGVHVTFRTKVVAVEPRTDGVWVEWERDGMEGTEEQCGGWYDKVVLAVPPDVVATIFPRLRKAMARIPCCVVDVVVEDMGRAKHVAASHEQEEEQDEEAEIITLLTRERATQAAHRHQSAGVVVTTTPLSFPLSTRSTPSSPLSQTRFTRVLRGVESGRIVRELFADEQTRQEKEWRSGDDGVFLVGGWCWDGLVLLEGCVRSAERVARALEVEVPW